MNAKAGPTVKKTMQPDGVREAGHAIFNWRDFDPATLNGKNDLVDEFTSHRDNLETLLQDRGKYVVIKGNEIIGIYQPKVLP